MIPESRFQWDGGTIDTSRKNEGVCRPNGAILILHFPRTTVDVVLANVVTLTGEENRRSINAQAAFSVIKLACEPLSSNALNE